MDIYRPLIDALLEHPSPSVRYKVRNQVLEEAQDSKVLTTLQSEIRKSSLVGLLLSERARDGTIPRNPYEKWRGAHWVLAMLAELAYPPGDTDLHPLRDQVLDWILSDEVRKKQTFLVNGRYRRHASQEGNLLFYLVRLGLADPRVDDIVSALLAYQWPDGGWNCDRRPEARTSTFTHSAIALRGLIAYQNWKPDLAVARAIGRASEFFLQRKLYFRLTTGEVIRDEFPRLTYPDYHFYTFLYGLKVMAEADRVVDPRCQLAFELLREKYTPGQGWQVEKKYYHTNPANKHRCSLVPWHNIRWGRANALLTADALGVLMTHTDQ